MNSQKWPEITEDTPLEEIKRIHQDIWDYVVKYGKKPDTPYIASCVACEYARKQFEYAMLFYEEPECECDLCPIFYRHERCNRCCSLYIQWAHLNERGLNSEEEKKIAEAIRDYPFKFEREEEHA